MADKFHQASSIKMVYNLMLKGVRKEIPAFEADELVGDGDLLPVAGGLRVLHNPGHTEGHIALISTNGEILFASDSCSNVVGLTSFPYYENLEQAHIDLEQLCQHQFEVAFFGHGSPVMEKAAQKFRAKFAGSEMSLA
ncbi:MAG: hypothetical protein U5L96_03595 [Owenweeksia sp.]|nr:hypothetical protein [Owenweeksia sp.]